MNKQEKKAYLDILQENKEEYNFLKETIVSFLSGESLRDCIHSVRHRLKDSQHFLEKIKRKNKEISEKNLALPAINQIELITKDNVLEKITDIAGVRVLHLHPAQFSKIHNSINAKISNGEFVFHENPKAYTWDKEYKEFFLSLGIETQIKDSYYTSVHYILKRNNHSIAKCEIQVRTLLEEVWGEIDHTMNYPQPTKNEECKEQLKILAKLIGSGSHLADFIMKTHAK